jgi:MFS family permease
MPRLPDSLEVLRGRDFRLLFGAQAASWFGDRMVSVALAFAVLQAGGSASAVGLVLASGTVTLIGCLLIGGVVADRYSRRTVMVAADLVRVASQGTMAVLLTTGAAEIWMLAVLAAITGAGSGFFNPASTGLLPAIVAPERLQQANGLRATVMSAGEIGGPVLSGLLVAAGGAGWAIGADAATFAISAALLARVHVPERVPRAATSFLADMRDGWSAFRSRTWVWSLVAAVAIGNVFWAAWSALGPVVADRDLGGAKAWGAVLAAMGVGALGGGLLATRAAPRRPLLVFALASGVFAIPLALLAAGSPVALLAAGALLAGVGLMLGNALWESALQRHIPSESLSRVSAYDWFGSFALYPVGLALWGPLAGAVGVSSALWLAAGLQLIVMLVLVAIPDIRRLPAAPPVSA